MARETKRKPVEGQTFTCRGCGKELPDCCAHACPDPEAFAAAYADELRQLHRQLKMDERRKL